MSRDEEHAVQPVLTVTDGAREKVLYIRSRDAEPERLALRLEVTGVARGAYTYEMTLQYLDSAEPGDVIQHHDDLAVIIPARSVDALRGATLYLEGDVTYGGIRLDNPNSPSPA